MAFARSRISASLPRLAPLSIIGRMAAAHRQRVALSKLTDAQLNDMGLTRSQAWHESNRPFWELPDRHRW